MKTKSARTTLTADQLLLVIIATQRDLRERFARRNDWNIPRTEEYLREARRCIRDLIAALRVLDRQYCAAAQREFLQRERLAACDAPALPDARDE